MDAKATPLLRLHAAGLEDVDIRALFCLDAGGAEKDRESMLGDRKGREACDCDGAAGTSWIQAWIMKSRGRQRGSSLESIAIASFETV